MTDNIESILDECLDRISRGETLDRCLARFPSVAEELRPLLETAAALDTCNFQPAFERRAAARRRFMKAAFKPKRSAAQFFSYWASWRGRAFAGAVTVIVMAIFSAFMLRSIFIGNGSSPIDIGPSATAVVSTVAPDAEGNFIFLVSDAPNAIGDFRSLTVTISKVYLQPKSTGSDKWFEFEPLVPTLDLTQLQGDAYQEVWRGSVPQGDYQNIVICTSEVTGVLVSGQQETVKLPSDKLQVSVPFTVGSEGPVSFTFDVTVVSTGNSGKYILKPQADESGAVSGKSAEADKTNNGKAVDNSNKGNSDNAASNSSNANKDNANNDNANNANTSPGNANNDKTKITKEPNN